jgi:uncharacterized protein YecT (DUF1311 family)
MESAPTPTAPSPTQEDTNANSAAPASQDSASNSSAAVATEGEETNYSETYNTCMSAGDAAQGATDAVLACTNDELSLQDAKLNETYRATMASLGAPEQLELLDAQRAWIANRDSTCAQDDVGSDQLSHSTCMLKLTTQRTSELEKLKKG